MDVSYRTTLELDKIIARAVQLCTCAETKEMMRAIEPFATTEEERYALAQTNAINALLLKNGSPRFGAVHEVRRVVAHAAKGGILSMGELLEIAAALRNFSGLAQWYGLTDHDMLPTDDLFFALAPQPVLEKQIGECIISPEEMADTASVTLRDLRRKIRATEDSIRTKLDAIIKNSTTNKFLQDAVVSIRNGRYVVPVRAEYRGEVGGVIHDVSSTGSTVFVEPTAVVEANARIMQLHAQEQEEITRILTAFSGQVASLEPQFSYSYDAMLQIDLLLAKARLAVEQNAFMPQVNDSCRFALKKARHPLIDKKKVVPVDIALGEKYDTLVITGPNTGGKTVSIKTAGLLNAMAQHGFLIPAHESSTVCHFDEYLVDIGDEQSIEQSLSTFSSHMTNTVDILKKADSNSLILFDEIGAGTDPTEGAALAIAILDSLHRRNITTMATTHYSEIKMYALTTDGVENACCEFDVQSLRPTYRLLIGVPGKSNAFAISKKLGLSDNIINDASRRLDSEDIKFEDLVTDLEQSRVTIEREREELNEYKAQIAQLKSELTKKTERLDERTDNIIRKANEEAARILKDAKEYADKTINAMNKHGMTVKELEKHRSAIREKMNKRQEKLKIEPANNISEHKAHDISEFKVGMHVKVLTMNVIGTVSQIHKNKNQVTVLVGSLSTKMDIKNLAILKGYKDPAETSSKPKGAGGSGKIKMSKSSSVSSEINLLGYTVDEAIAVLDKYLDDAYIARIPQVRIVHGKGTGALRSGITSYLHGVPYIKEFRLGQIGEGAEGVTIVTFKD